MLTSNLFLTRYNFPFLNNFLFLPPKYKDYNKYVIYCHILEFSRITDGGPVEIYRDKHGCPKDVIPELPDDIVYVLRDSNYSTCVNPFTESYHSFLINVDIDQSFKRKQEVGIVGKHILCSPTAGVLQVYLMSQCQDNGQCGLTATCVPRDTQTSPDGATKCTFTCTCVETCNYMVVIVSSMTHHTFSYDRQQMTICEILV